MSDASPESLSDKAVAVFAFAAYHELESGQAVRSVVRADGRGHKAAPDAIAELSGKGLIDVRENDAYFTEAGRRMLDAVLAAVRSAAAES